MSEEDSIRGGLKNSGRFRSFTGENRKTRGGFFSAGKKGGEKAGEGVLGDHRDECTPL